MNYDVRLAMERELCGVLREHDGTVDDDLLIAICDVASRTVAVERTRQRERIAAYVERRGMLFPGENPPEFDSVANGIRDGEAER